MPSVTSKLSKAARRRVRERLQARPKIAIVASVISEHGDAGSVGIATLADALSTMIGIDIDHLRPDETLRDALRVQRDELSSDVRDLFSEIGLENVIDPFAFSLLDLAEKRFREDPSRVQRAVFIPLPSNEDEWVDRLLDMTVSEFLNALA